MNLDGQGRHVVIVGGGFAGLSAARELAKHDDVRVTLIDKNPYHQFQPLLYQVATYQLASPDITNVFRRMFAKHPNVEVKLSEVTSVDPEAMSVTTSTGEAI